MLTWGARIPVVRIGRMAGQYAKPRSSDTEMVDGREVYTYRGDHVNGHAPDDRDPDPARLVQAYYHAAATLNYARAVDYVAGAAFSIPAIPFQGNAGDGDRTYKFDDTEYAGDR